MAGEGFFTTKKKDMCSITLLVRWIRIMASELKKLLKFIILNILLNSMKRTMRFSLNVTLA